MTSSPQTCATCRHALEVDIPFAYFDTAAYRYCALTPPPLTPTSVLRSANRTCGLTPPRWEALQ